MTSFAEQMRAWRGPAILTFGFRLSALLPWCRSLGCLILRTAFDPRSWQAITFPFGHLAAVFAGFLLEAALNGTLSAPRTGNTDQAACLFRTSLRCRLPLCGVSPLR